MTIGSDSQAVGGEPGAEMADPNLKVETNVIDPTTTCSQSTQSESTPPHRHSSDDLKSTTVTCPDQLASAQLPSSHELDAPNVLDSSSAESPLPSSPSSNPSSNPSTLPSPLSPLAIPPSPYSQSLSMPKVPTLTNLPDLTLHSPNTQIVGTPFTTNNANKFEYPFPDSSSSSTDSTPSTTINVPSFSNSFPSIVPSSQLSNSPPSLSNFPTSFPPQNEISGYTLTHPKMRQPNSPPPMPPGLVKKKHRWSLGLLGRRRSSYGSETSAGSAGTSTTTTSMDAVVEHMTPGPGKPS